MAYLRLGNASLSRIASATTRAWMGILCLPFFALSPSSASAQSPASTAVPPLINYQGKLTDAAGDALPTKDYVISFSIYDGPNEGASRVWGPQVFDGATGMGHGATVPVVKGFFNVILGRDDTSGAPITRAFDSPIRFLEIKVGDGSPVLPRQQILSTGYSFQAEQAERAALAESIGADTADPAFRLVPPRAVLAFNQSTCPLGWSPYLPAVGRFIRGLDASGSRVLGSQEEDAFQGHTFGDPRNNGRTLVVTDRNHNPLGGSGFSEMPVTGIFGANDAYGARHAAVIRDDATNGAPRIANETRPKNVALLYCVKN